MSNPTWTKEDGVILDKPQNNTWKFIAIVVALVAAVAFVIFNALNSNGGTQLFLTVNEYLGQEATLADRDIRVSGWVLGETIEFTQIDSDNSVLEFEIVDDLNNPTERLRVVAYNEPLPDLLQHETQALVEGRGHEDGAFYANEGGLLLKCPTRYEEEQVSAE